MLSGVIKMKSNRIKTLRKLAGYSQEQIARKLNVSQGAVSQWERGVTIPASEQLLALADILHVSIDDLLDRSQEGAQVDADAYAIRERLRRDPAFRLLYQAADRASPEHLRAAAAMLKSLEGSDDD